MEALPIEYAPPAWMRDAACLEVDDETAASFFPEGKGATSAPAKAVCRGCLVREECLAYALDEGIAHGVWGGLGWHERAKVRRGEAA